MLKEVGKKFTAITLCVVMLFSATPSVLVQATDVEFEPFDDYEAIAQGLTMTPEQFTNAFTGDPESRFMPFNLEETQLAVHNIALNGSNISLDLVLSPESPLGTIVDVNYSAYVTQLSGNQNDLTITVEEHFESGFINTLVETFRINNNGSGSFNVGNYEVFVSTRGNDQIREIRLLSDGSTVLPIRGTLFVGNREESALVIEVDDLVNGYELLLFEINTNPTVANLLLPKSYASGLFDQSHMKIYLLSPDNELLIFETEMPESLRVLEDLNFENLEHADDILWVMDFVDLSNAVLQEVDAMPGHHKLSRRFLQER